VVKFIKFPHKINHKGEKNSNINFLLKGKVNLYYPKKPKLCPILSSFNDLPIKSFRDPFEESLGLAQNEFKPIENHCFYNDNNTFCYIFEKVFNERELIIDESPYILQESRIGTAVCLEDCEILTVSKADYESSKEEFEKQNQSKIFLFLKENLPEFSLDLIYLIYPELNFDKWKKNERVHNEKHDYLYLVYKGAITVKKIEFNENKSHF